MRLFLDVEWESEAPHELVSLALVSQDGRQRFYAERDPLPVAPSAFVREVVYPLLDRGSVALPDPTLTRELRAFFAQVEAPLVLADSSLDLTLLARVLSGFDQPDLAPAPPYRSMLITFGDVQMRVEDYFEHYPLAKARRHHAMVDAEALRWTLGLRSGDQPRAAGELNAHAARTVTPKMVTFALRLYLIPNGRPKKLQVNRSVGPRRYPGTVGQNA